MRDRDGYHVRQDHGGGHSKLNHSGARVRCDNYGNTNTSWGSSGGGGGGGGGIYVGGGNSTIQAIALILFVIGVLGVTGIGSTMYYIIRGLIHDIVVYTQTYPWLFLVLPIPQIVRLLKTKGNKTNIKVVGFGRIRLIETEEGNKRPAKTIIYTLSVMSLLWLMRVDQLAINPYKIVLYETGYASVIMLLRGFLIGAYIQNTLIRKRLVKPKEYIRYITKLPYRDKTEEEDTGKENLRESSWGYKNKTKNT